MKEKKRFWELVLEHPIATFIIISALCTGIVNVVNAFKGNEYTPVLDVKVNLIQSSGEEIVK